MGPPAENQPSTIVSQLKRSCFSLKAMCSKAFVSMSMQNLSDVDAQRCGSFLLGGSVVGDQLHPLAGGRKIFALTVTPNYNLLIPRKPLISRRSSFLVGVRSCAFPAKKGAESA